MRVLHVIDTLKGGGVENLLLNIVPHVHEQNIELGVIHLHNEPDLVPVLRAQNVPVVGICRDRFRYFKRTRQERREQTDKALAFTRDFMPDVIHAHLECSYLFAPMIAKKLDVPVVHTVHTAKAPWQTSTQLKIALMRQLILRIFKKADKVLTVGEGARQYLAQLVPSIASEIGVVENCVGDIYTSPLPKGKPCDYDVIMVGRLSPEKNHELALRAFSQVVAKRPMARMAIVGFGSEEAKIKRIRRDLGLDASVDLLGRKDAAEICDLLDRSRVHHMPSSFEGFGIAAAEALFRGLPSVLNNIPVLSQLFGRLPGVRLAKPGNVDDHASQLLLALDDEAVHDHRDYLKRFTATHHVAQLRAVYDGAIENRQ